MQERRAGGSHVDLLGPRIEQPLDDILQLGAPHDGVLAEQQPLAVDHLLDGNQLHACHQVAHTLLLGHEAAGPGRRVLHEGAPVGDACRGGIADGVAGAGVGAIAAATYPSMKDGAEMLAGEVRSLSDRIDNMEDRQKRMMKIMITIVSVSTGLDGLRLINGDWV